LHPPSLGEFLHEFVGHYVALEGALWTSLRLLLLRPGGLTREYLAGRRRRYVLPLRLYLSASFLFFLVLKLVPSAGEAVLQAPAGAHPAGVGAAAEARIGADAAAPRARESEPAGASAPITPQVLSPVDCGAAGRPACGPFERLAQRAAARYNADPQGLSREFRSHLVGSAPYAVFLLLPVFAAITMLAYRNRRMTYGEHVVFSLHLHAFWFLALPLVALLPPSAGDLLIWIVPLYGVLALHAVYGGRWGPTLARAAFVSLAYGLLVLLASALLIFLVALLAIV